MTSVAASAAGTADAPPVLWQYWDDPSPPADVAALVARMGAVNAGLRPRLLDRAGAARLIGERCGGRAHAAFLACACPAMQADYLRLCLMESIGGLYVDVDEVALEPFSTLMAEAGEGVLPAWLVLGNNPLYLRRPHNAFIAHCREVATETILTRRFDAVLAVAGPALLTAVRAGLDPQPGGDVFVPAEWKASFWPGLRAAAAVEDARRPMVKAALDSLTHMPTDRLVRFCRPAEPAYKNGPLHWLNWRGPVFRED